MALGPSPPPYEPPDPAVLLLDEPVLPLDESEPLPAANTEVETDKKKKMNRKQVRMSLTFFHYEFFDQVSAVSDFTIAFNKTFIFTIHL